MDTPDEEDLISGAEAAALLGIDRANIRRHVRLGKLVEAAVVWEGKRRRPRFRRSDVEALRPSSESTAV